MSYFVWTVVVSAFGVVVPKLMHARVFEWFSQGEEFSKFADWPEKLSWCASSVGETCVVAVNGVWWAGKALYLYSTVVLVIRRLHDGNLHAGWVLAVFGSMVTAMVTAVVTGRVGISVAALCALWLLVWLPFPSAGENRFGAPRVTAVGEKVLAVVLAVLFVVLMVWQPMLAIVMVALVAFAPGLTWFL